MQPINCVVVGDGGVGKTCLLVSYVTNKFPSEYVPAALETLTPTVMIGGDPYRLNIFDNSGQEDCDGFWTLNYHQEDVYIVCFSVVSPSSFENVIKKWVPEITRFRFTTNHKCYTPFLLVGTQIDLRDDASTIDILTKTYQKPVSFENGERQARELGAAKYVECSALTQKGLRNVFDEAILAALEPPEPSTRSKCLLM